MMFELIGIRAGAKRTVTWKDGVIGGDLKMLAETMILAAEGTPTGPFLQQTVTDHIKSPLSSYVILYDLFDKVTRENAELKAVTRRDPTLVARIWPVAEAFTAIILLDHYMMHLGYQSMWRK